MIRAPSVCRSTTHALCIVADSLEHPSRLNHQRCLARSTCGAVVAREKYFSAELQYLVASSPTKRHPSFFFFGVRATPGSLGTSAVKLVRLLVCSIHHWLVGALSWSLTPNRPLPKPALALAWPNGPKPALAARKPPTGTATNYDADPLPGPRGFPNAPASTASSPTALHDLTANNRSKAAGTSCRQGQRRLPALHRTALTACEKKQSPSKKPSTASTAPNTTTISTPFPTLRLN